MKIKVILSKKNMKNILIATDFSNGSKNAIRIGREMCDKLNAKIIYFHSYIPPILDPNVPIGIIDETFKIGIAILEDKLKAEVEIDKIKGRKSEFYLEIGDIINGIDSVNKKDKLDLVIIAKTGSSGFFEKLLGSTASHLINNISIPILVIPEQFEDNLFENIYYASQLEYEEISFIKETIKLSKNSKLPLTILYIKEKSELDINPNENFIKEIKENINQKDYSLSQKDGDSFVEEIITITENKKISLLSVASHKRNILSQLLNPSKTKKLIESIKIPLLVFSFK